MTILQVVYASAPSDEILLPTLEIQIPGREPIRVVNGFEDQWLGVDGELVLFQACAMSIALPKKDTSGRQALTFGIGNVNGQLQEYIDAALEAGQPVPLIYREYLASDKSAPASRPHVLTMGGGVLEGDTAQFEAAYYDLLNAAWPRERYTAENAPGLKYV